MNTLIEQLNALGAQALSVAWPMLWQSSLLIGLMLALEPLLRRKLRPGIRYALWLMILLKLVLPPSLALPTGLAWWVRPQTPVVHHAVRNVPVVVSYGPISAARPAESVIRSQPPEPTLTLEGGGVAGAGVIGFALFVFMLCRWKKVARQAGRSASPTNDRQVENLSDLLEEARRAAGVRQRVGLRLVEDSVSPALYGLLRPVILLPRTLVDRLSPTQVRTVLLHELVHLRRADVWVNCVQALLQTVYWWHPLLWVANSRIRRVREEAVDDAVMLALCGEAEHYAPTLLEVARLAVAGPLAGLGLVGILESQSALRQRIERLVDFRPPRKAGVTLVSALCVIAFGALALPMGEAPADSAAEEPGASANMGSAQRVKPDAKIQTQVLTQDGKLLFEMGKLDEAEKKLKEALEQDPRNQAAYYYLNLIKEARRKQQLASGVRNPTSGRLRIMGKLDKLRLDSIEFDGVPLSEAVKTLIDRAKRLDPAGEGVTFILSQKSSAASRSDATDIGQVVIRLRPALTNVRLADVLDAIVKTADKPIQYSLEDYGVVFSSKRNEPAPLYMRMIKVDPNTFEYGLRSVVGGSQNETQDTVKAAREFFANLGVDLSSPKSIAWDNRQGTLVVRATLQELDTIENAIQVLNMAPEQVNIKARFIELPEREAADFWVKYLNRNVTPGNPWASELTSYEAASQLDAWKGNSDVSFLAQPSITTLSGRQAEVQIGELQQIDKIAILDRRLTDKAVPVGPKLSVVPVVSSDGFTITLAGEASVTEFLGYDDTGFAGAKFDTYKDHQGDAVVRPGVADEPLAHFETRKLPFACSIKDGRTLALRYPVNIRTPSPAGTADTRKTLLVFVTPTIIDPAGNRQHTDEEIDKAAGGVRR